MLWESNIKSSLRSRAEKCSACNSPAAHPAGAAQQRAKPGRSGSAMCKSSDFSWEKCDFSPCAAVLNRFNTRKSDDV
jgi:hypothetical protein